MRIFHITSKPPFPIVDGGCFASAELLRALLLTGYEIVHLSITTQKHPGNKSAYPPELKTIELFPLDTTITFGGALKNVLTNKSYNIQRFISLELEAYLEENLTSDDILFIDGLYASTALRKEPNAKKIIYRAHNVEYSIWQDLANGFSLDKGFRSETHVNKPSFVKRVYYKYLSKLLKKYELEVLKNVDHTFTISNEDLDLIKAQGIQNCSILPVSMKPVDKSHDYSMSSSFHVGSYNWEPNKESIDLLYRLYQTGEYGKLYLVGKDIPYHSSDSVHVLGFIENLDEFYQKQGILVAPILSGSGVRIKVLEALANGIPVITTSKGGQGIGDASVLVICDNEEQLKNQIKKLTASERERKECGEKSLNYIRSHHSIDNCLALIRRGIED